MATHIEYRFSATLDIIGVNPFVSLPAEVLAAVFLQAGKSKGNIPVRGTINSKPYRQTLVRYCNEWRLYINQVMLAKSPKRIPPHPMLVLALQSNEKANAVFQRLRPSLQHEIIRYIASLKSERSVDKNVARAISFLMGETSFIGRQAPDV